MKFRNRLLLIFATLFKYPKLKDFFLLMLHLLLSMGLIDDDEYRVYSGEQAKNICDMYVLDQKLYLTKEYKDIIDQWSSRYFQGLNEYIRGLINPSFNKIREYEKFRKDLSSLIESTEGLYVNTVLFRGEKDVDVESRFCINEENEFCGFIATSFSYNKAKKFSDSSFNKNYIIKINAKKETKGIAINGVEVGVYRGQNEWLLNENQRYITKKIDEKNKIIEIELI